jgi:hypothetical protein
MQRHNTSKSIANFILSFLILGLPVGSSGFYEFVSELHKVIVDGLGGKGYYQRKDPNIVIIGALESLALYMMMNHEPAYLVKEHMLHPFVLFSPEYYSPAILEYLVKYGENSSYDNSNLRDWIEGAQILIDEMHDMYDVANQEVRW